MAVVAVAVVATVVAVESSDLQSHSGSWSESS